jgi:hypothetical protein
MRRKQIVAVAALGLMLLAFRTTPAYARVVTATRNFQHCFQSLRVAHSTLNPFERVVLSFVLASSKSDQPQRAFPEPQPRS